VDGLCLKLTNLDKEFWPGGLTKAHLIKYYSEVAPVLLPYIARRPLVMKRYPDGITGESFYQKECPSYAPDWIKTASILHRRSGKRVNYIICSNTATLLWLANQGCIEVHAWLSSFKENNEKIPKYEQLNCPDIAVMDLDPPEGFDFGEVCRVAVLARHILEEFGLKSFPKTSGARGMHIFIPLQPYYTFDRVAEAMEYVAKIVHKACPMYTTLERSVKKRGNKIYLDYLQNGRGKTMVFPYSLRPLPGAPVSTPLAWHELEKGNLDPADYNFKNIFDRLKEFGDLYGEFFKTKQAISVI